MAEISPLIGVPQTGVSPTLDVRPPDDAQDITPKVGTALQGLGGASLDLSKVFGQVQVNDVTNNVMAQARAITDKYTSLRGADALNAQASTQEALNKVFADGAGQLGSIDQVNQYNQTTRTYQDRYFGGMIAQHAASAQLEYTTTVNQNTMQSGLDTIGGNPTSQDAFTLGMNQVIGAKVKQLQLDGNASDPAMLKQAVTEGTQAAWLTRIQAVGAHDPAAALQMADQNQALLGDKYASVYDVLRTRADQQTGTMAGDAALAGLGGGTQAPAVMPVVAPGSIAPDRLPSLFDAQESGGNTNTVSSQGAVGAAGIIPATFNQFAMPGESIANPKDNAAVQQRMLNTYYQNYGGDLSRVAVAYFSGPGNVAPPGSPTPWIKDTSDANGKSVSSYTSDILTRATGGTPAPDMKSAAYQNILNDPNLTDAQRQIALDHVNQVLAAQQISQQSTEQARSAADEKAASSYMTQLLTAQMNGGIVPPDLTTKIVNDPALSAASKKALFDIALSASGQNKTIGYGAGYSTAYKMILAPDGTPGKITDPVQILRMGAPGGPLTPAGVASLIATFHEANGSVDQAGIAQAKDGILDYAKSKLYFGQEPMFPGDPGLKDTAGLQIFDSKFIPQFESAYNNWVKAGKDPMQFLQDTSMIDSMITRLRPPSQMAADQLAAENDENMGDDAAPGATPDKSPPIKMPETIKNPDNWNSLVAAPPETATGPISQDQWSQALGILMQNPKQNSAYFNKWFGPLGYDAQDVIAQLNNPPPPQMKPDYVR
jgi:hypothetical protein